MRPQLAVVVVPQVAAAACLMNSPRDALAASMGLIIHIPLRATVYNVSALSLFMLLQLLFDAMENTPCSLALSYSLQAVGMDYDRAMFGMKLSDCR